MNYQNSIVALITPMIGAEIDYFSLEKLLELHLSSQTHSLVLGGTTGESPTLTPEELTKIFLLASKFFPPERLIVGCGGNNTAQVILQANRLQDLGVGTILSVAPYYNKPPQEGLLAHFSALAASISIPIILYNVPSRTNSSLEFPTIKTLTEAHSNIVGIKDCTGDFAFLKKLNSLREDFVVLLGEDALTLEAFGLGLATGSINVIGNVFPKSWAKICSLAKNNPSQVEELFNKIKKIIPLLFTPANPIPIKFLAHQLGLIEVGIRLPLVWLPEQYQADLLKSLSELTDVS